MSDLDALIERLEKATGPDRTLGNDILFASGWTMDEHGEGDVRTTIWTAPRGEEFLDGDQPDPTASIDAALTLLPPGERWSLLCFDNGRAQAESYNEMADGNTPVLALAAVALKARSLENKGGGE